MSASKFTPLNPNHDLTMCRADREGVVNTTPANRSEPILETIGTSNPVSMSEFRLGVKALGHSQAVE